MRNRKAFTLIELSIVLVIIGLIVGGVLVGRDLIRASEIRSQLSQIEQYQTAMNTFKNTYGYLPGDVNSVEATKYGFVTRTGNSARGDGNGIIGCLNYNNLGVDLMLQSGESALFWVDLSTAKLINNSFTTATDGLSPITPITLTTTPSIKDYLPQAKLGNNFIYVLTWNNVNYFGISNSYSIANTGVMWSNPGLSVAQAFAMDSKTDDGKPQAGRIQAFYANSWQSGIGGYTDAPNAATASASTCFDTTSGNYSIDQNRGNGVNCALSFKFQ